MYPTTLGYEGPAEIRLYERLLERFNATHGVVQASMARHYMLQGARNFRRVSGIPAAVNVIAPGFFSTMRIALLSGRDFSPDDRADGAHVAIVDQHYADNKFPGENPLGKTVDFGGQTYRVVGVAANVRYFSLRQESSIPASQVFFPFTQVPRDQLGQMCFALRTSLDPALVLADARREAFAVEKNLPVVMATTQARQAEGSMREEWSLGILTAMFAVMAVLLACLGLYGTIAYTTARRTNEIGVRMALGASRAGVMRMVWNESALLVAAGVAIGTPGTIAAARSIRTWLFGVSPNDPLTIAAAAAVMIAVAAIAGFIPARRASRVDPVVALRHE
jgi:predicted permease